MAFMSTISIIGSGITAQHLRLDVISENVTNMNTTRTEEGGAYRRKLTVFQAVDGRDTFRNVLALTQNGMVSNVRHENTGGVKVVRSRRTRQTSSSNTIPRTRTPTRRDTWSCPMWIWSWRWLTQWPPVRRTPPT